MKKTCSGRPEKCEESNLQDIAMKNAETNLHTANSETGFCRHYVIVLALAGSKCKSFY